VNDNKVASVNCPNSSLAPGASETCTGSYTVTQADVDNGSVTNTATASGTNPSAATVNSNSSSVTVEASNATSSLHLTDTPSPTTFTAAGNVIHYSFGVTNTGTTTLHAIAVSDNTVSPVSCPNSSLAPGASETCTGSYTTTTADVNAGSVTDTSTASGTNPSGSTITSAQASATVNDVALRITTSSLPTGTKGHPYSATLSAAGGTAPYKFGHKASTPLPSGLTLSTSGVISGKPTVKGTFTIGFKVKDSASPTKDKAQRTLTISIS
jgi:hypothetical protein